MEECDFVTEINIRVWYEYINKIHKKAKMKL